MKIPFYQVDAFTQKPFHGNPAAVCPLDAWLPDELLQAIAAENNLAETAFFVKQPDGFGLRWFTPLVEMDLCGHATLAGAHILYEQLGYISPSIPFHTKSGLLQVSRLENGSLLMDFPSRPGKPAEPDPALLEAIGHLPDQVLLARDYLFVYPNEEAVLSINPNYLKLGSLSDVFAVIVTAPGKEVDFVSRFFAPGAGVNEDPVTGSAHSTLIPYWARRLGKHHLTARQLSQRGGELFCEDKGERVSMGGYAVTVVKGEFTL